MVSEIFIGVSCFDFYGLVLARFYEIKQRIDVYEE